MAPWSRPTPTTTAVAVAARAINDNANPSLRTTTTWTYRTSGGPDNLVASISSPVTSFAYTYDENKNKLKETIGGVMSPYGFNSTSNAAYDAEDRLTSWTRDTTGGDALAQSWALSPVGDWNTFTENTTPVTRAHNAVHELTGVGGTSVSHDPRGNLTKDAGQTNAKYAWDFDNRLAQADTNDDTVANASYRYDALGRRVSKSVINDETTTTTVYVNDGMQEVAEYQLGANPASDVLLRKFVYADYIDEPVMLVTGGGTKYYYHQNNLSSVAALTDSSGNAVERYSYTAYGRPTFHWPAPRNLIHVL